MIQIREPAVADYFYPADSGELSATIHQMLHEAPVLHTAAPKALIVPHAGYIYSGPVAATAYASLRPHRDEYTRVVLLGPQPSGCGPGPGHERRRHVPHTTG